MAPTQIGFCEALRPGGASTGGNWYDPIFKRARETYGLSPYAFGGDRAPGLSQGPWDCVGWVMECFDAANIDIDPEHDEPYTNAERARQATTPIDEAEVQPGDLVFFQGTYDTPGASHIGIVVDPARKVMADDHDRGNGTGPGETNYGELYWQQHLMGFTRVSRSFSEPPMTPSEANVGGFSMEPDHAFSLAELWPTIQAHCTEYSVDPKILAGMIQQESTFHNYRVHMDGTGHGLLGYDDNGLLADFEKWSGLSIGRGASAAIIPVEPQIEFCARQLRRYADAYPGEDEYVGARAWHAGGGGRNSANGKNYEQIVRGRIVELGI